MFLTSKQADDFKNRWIKVVGVLLVLFAVFKSLEVWPIVGVFWVSVISSFLVFMVVDCCTPAYYTNKLQKLLSSLGFLERINRRSSDTDEPFCAKVIQYYRQDPSTADLPFPLGLAHENLIRFKKEIQAAIAKIARVCGIWKSEGDQLATWD